MTNSYAQSETPALALYGRGVDRQRAGDPAGLADIEQASRLRADVADVMGGIDDP